MKLYFKLRFLVMKWLGKLPETSGDIVDKLDWADREINETEERLLSLYHRLLAGTEAMKEAQSDAERIIKRHEEILDKARNRQIEFEGKSQVTKDIIDKLEKEVK